MLISRSREVPVHGCECRQRALSSDEEREREREKERERGGLERERETERERERERERELSWLESIEVQKEREVDSAVKIVRKEVSSYNFFFLLPLAEQRSK
jgi:hypothetical protein